MITDRFHENKQRNKDGNLVKINHQNCPSAFSFDYWDNLSSLETWQGGKSSVNSSTAEQLNAKLRRLNKHILYASLSHAKLALTVFMSKHNHYQKARK